MSLQLVFSVWTAPWDKFSSPATYFEFSSYLQSASVFVVSSLLSLSLSCHTYSYVDIVFVMKCTNYEWKNWTFFLVFQNSTLASNGYCSMLMKYADMKSVQTSVRAWFIAWPVEWDWVSHIELLCVPTCVHSANHANRSYTHRLFARSPLMINTLAPNERIDQ